MAQSYTRAVLLDPVFDRQDLEQSAVRSASASRFYRPELDVLRFCAFLMVFLGHAMTVRSESPDWLKALKCIPGFGVPLFFALSAYLVTELLTAEKRLTGTVNARYFYSRRILRIWPLYFLALGIGVLLSCLHPGTTVPLFGLLSYMLLVGNWYTTRYGYLPSGMGPLWSISIEEQFYLLWPWVVRICSRGVLALICATAWICSQASLLYLCHHHAMNNPAIWASSLVQLQYFAIGIGLSLCLNGSVPTIRGEVRLLIIIAAFLLFPAAELLFNANALRSFDDRSSIAHTYPTYLLGGVSVLAILIGFLGCRVFESWRGVRYLGKISYGLYVYHPIAIGLAGDITQSFAQYSMVLIVSGLLADICIAWLSYEYFEKPFMRIKERFAIVKSRAA